MIRKIDRLVNGLISNKINIYDGLNWETSKAINASGNVYTAGSANFKVASVRLNKGTKVDYCLFSNSLLPVIATGDSEKPITIIDVVPDGGASDIPVIGSYEVVNDTERYGVSQRYTIPYTVPDPLRRPGSFPPSVHPVLYPVHGFQQHSYKTKTHT